MTKTLSFSSTNSGSLIKTGLIAAAFTVMALPAMASAATFAYVNQSGEVVTVQADTAAQAMLTAPGIDENSGVLLLDSSADNAVVGDDVGGV